MVIAVKITKSYRNGEINSRFFVEVPDASEGDFAYIVKRILVESCGFKPDQGDIASYSHLEWERLT